MTSGKRSSLKQLALRNAATIAHKHSKSNRLACSAKDYCKFAKDAIEFQILALTTEQSLLDTFSIIESETEKLGTLFQLFVLSNSDEKGEGKVCTKTLRKGLEKVPGSTGLVEKIFKAINDSTSDQQVVLDLEGFTKVMKTMVEKVGCTMDELTQIIIIECVFASTVDMVNDGIGINTASLVPNDVEGNDEEIEYRKTLLDERMSALFALFDLDHDGLISFKEVVLGMYKITDQIDGTSKAAVNALLLFDENHCRALDYEAFTKLIINVVAASPDHVRFNDVADDMTRHAAKPMELSVDDVSHLFAMDSGLELLKTLEEEKTQSEPAQIIKLNSFEVAKVNRLFDIWDLDHDGYIDFQELALGMRKFQETTQLHDTVEESIRVMNAFDTNDDQKLDRKEFTSFIAKFACMLHQSNTVDLIDFMLVAVSLKNNSDAEMAYINSIKSSDIYYWGC